MVKKGGLTVISFSDKKFKRFIVILGKIFPVRSKDDAPRREKAKAAARAGDFGSSVERAAAVVNGKLNRAKLLLGTCIFYEPELPFGEDKPELLGEGGFDFVVTEAQGHVNEMLKKAAERLGIAIIGKSEGQAKGIREMKNMLDSGTLPVCNENEYFAGSIAMDEPRASEYAVMEEYRKLFKKSLPEKFLFYNLFPAAPAKRLSAKSYRDYIERYAKEVGTDYISIDQYPFFSFGLLRHIGLLMTFITYDTVSSVCRNYGLDFWAYMQSQGNWFDRLYLLPTFEHIKWQCYTLLAYGARSIIHVSFTPVWGDEAYGMLDYDGNVTEQYIFVKEVNRELQALSGVYMKYDSLGVRTSVCPRMNFDMSLPFLYQKFKSRSFVPPEIIKNVRSVSPALVGYFKEHGGNGTALMLVNCRSLYSPYADNTYSVEFTSPVNAEIYTCGVLSEAVAWATSLTVKSGSCDGIFITIRAAD